ncbi:MAG: GntR family transcriptional regulator [Planctomycetia bacterium]
MQSTLLSNRVYEQLYEAMLTNRLVPGDRLNRRQVAADLGVSVMPVLEAMTQLEWEGFLETSPRRGTVVRPITATQALGRFHVRQALEVEAARLYAGEPIRQAREKLLKVARRLDATPVGSLANFRAEVEFHDLLVEQARSPVLYEAFTHVMRHSLYHAANRLLPEVPGRSAHIHSRLVEALVKASPGQADTLIREHLAPWIEKLTAAAASEAAEPEPVSFARVQSKSLKPKRTRSRGKAARS